MRLYKLLSLLIIVLTGCANQNNKGKNDGMGRFDVNESGTKIAFSWTENGRSSIYVSDIEGTNTRLAFSSKTISFYNPKWINDSSEVAFIGVHNEPLNRSIWIGSLKSGESKQITDSTSIKTEVIYSKNNKLLYFVAGSDYNNYSPIARKAVHGMDIYSVDYVKNTTNKLTDLNAYTLSGLTLYGDSLVFSVHADFDGIGLLNLMSKKVSAIIKSQESSTKPEFYLNPCFVNDSLILVTSFRDLMLAKIKNGEKVKIRSSNNLDNICFVTKMSRIFYKYEGDASGDIFSMNLNGLEPKTIKLKPN